MGQVMQLKDVFLFTQHSLATFDKCPLKFKKRYTENLKWENISDEKVKERFQRGIDFHLLAHRMFLGMMPEKGEQVDETLDHWIGNLREFFRWDLEAKYLPEHKLRLSDNGMRLEANYDLLVVKDNIIEVWDWKTSDSLPNKKKNEEYYRNSLQTKVYLYVLRELEALVTGKSDLKCAIKMLYWQPEPPGFIASIDYTDEMHVEFYEILKNKIKHIETFDFDNFNKDEYKKQCRVCEFNWYCNREKVDFEAISEEFSIDDLEMEDIEELY